MDKDLSKFHQTFFEDSFENIIKVEDLLLKIDLSKVTNETIDDIFRCAHSIKGSSGMFGFTSIMEFTHVLENYLELVRDGKLHLTSESVELLLKSFDCLRVMLDDVKNKRNGDISVAKKIEVQFARLNVTHNDKNKTQRDDKDNNLKIANDDSKSKTWKIFFKPHLKIFQNGDDPLRILRALKTLGEMTSEVDSISLPIGDKFYPDECYLAWNIVLITTKNEEEIRKHAFEWVEDESLIRFVQAESEEQNILNDKTKSDEVSDNYNLNKELTSIRVSIEKVDELINMVGELVITQSMLTQITNNIDINNTTSFKESLMRLENNCKELQECVMRIRMLPMSNIFNRFPRMVHDLGKLFGKKVDLRIMGENTELDKSIAEKVIDPLVHLVRNALDHGIESPEERMQCGKSDIGVIHLNAFQQGSNIIIQISDDGRGLNQEKIIKKARAKALIKDDEKLSDEQVNELIFLPGFSTAEEITDLSGRGVGMDVVRKNIEYLGGRVDVKSILGKGSTFTICLPLTLAIIEGQLMRVGECVYIMPLTSMIETIQIKLEHVTKIDNKVEVYQLRGNYIPIIRLYEIFNIEVNNTNLEDHLLVIVEINQQQIGIMIDELLQLQQVVIKSLKNNYGHIEGVLGATILADGSVALILDVLGLARVAQVYQRNTLNVNQYKTVA